MQVPIEFPFTFLFGFRGSVFYLLYDISQPSFLVEFSRPSESMKRFGIYSVAPCIMEYLCSTFSSISNISRTI